MRLSKTALTGLQQRVRLTPRVQRLGQHYPQRVQRNDIDSIEVRHHSLAVGVPLPVEIPLAIGGQGHMVLNLEATYEEARERSRL